MEGARTVASLASVVLQASPANGSDNDSDIPGQIEASSERWIEFVGQFFPAWVPDWSIRSGFALLVVLLAWYGSKLLVRLLGRRVARRFRRPSITRTVLRSIRAGAMFVAVLVAAAAIGVPFGDLVLSVTVLTAAVGVVIAPIIGSVINGLFVLSDQSYEIGDMIEIADTDRRGFIEDITLRYTKIFTLDNTFLVIPNGTMRERDVINYSAEDARTRLSLDLLVTYEGDLAQARRLIERAAREVDVVIEGGPDIRIGSARYPAAPTCYIDTYADHGVSLRLHYWVEEPYKLLAVRSAVQENVWHALEGADVEFAYPHSHLVFDDTSGELSVGLDGSEGPYDSRDGRRTGRTDRTDERGASDDRGGTPSGRGETPHGRGGSSDGEEQR